MEKKVLIAFGLILFLITLYSTIAQEENKTILVPLGELANETKEGLPGESEEVVEEIPGEVKEIVEEGQESEEELVITPPQPGIFTKIVNFGISAFYKVKYIGWWFLTRDYISFAKNILRFVLGLRLWMKIILIIIAIIIMLIIWAYFFRNTRNNNLRRARTHHRKGEAAHAIGDEEAAEYNYTKAAEYREKAQNQW